MLQLIIGTAGTGKSQFIKEKILNNASKGRKSVLIVPEQFSKTGEAEIFSSLEKSQFGFVNVFSFTSLLRDVYTEQGAVVPVLLTDAGKAVMAQKALQTVHKQLTSYHNQKKNVAFSYELGRIFEDFRRNGIDSTQLYDIAQAAPQINAKLKDISLIYTQYCAYMGQGGSDLEQVYIQLGESLPVSYTDSTDYFVDGFESFSFGQYAILSRIMEKADNVYITLTADRVFDNTNGTHPLSYTAKTAEKLLMYAKKKGVTAAPAIRLEQQHRFLTTDLKNIDNFLLSKPLTDTETDSSAYITAFETQFEEVCFAAAKISQLTKEGYSYDDIAVVCPQLEKYEHQLQESFSLAKIPYFIDQSRIILSSAPVVLFKAVLEVMEKGISSRSILPLLKTQLTKFDSETVNWLENYLYIWQDNDLDWSKPFNLPYGRISDGEVEEGDDLILSAINSLVYSVKDVFSKWQNTGEALCEDILSAMYAIITDLGCETVLEEIINSTEDKDKADLILRQWETAVECVNQLYRICGSMVMRPGELQQLFMLMVQGTEIGFAPQTQDCVLISTPQRMKTDAVKVVLVLGASQDIFPSIVSDSGILSSADVQYLKENNCEISADFAQRFAFENLYFYKTLTTAREKLFVSCALKNIDSSEIMSAEIESIKKALGLGADSLAVEDYCITEEFFCQYIGETKGEEGAEYLASLGISVPHTDSRRFDITDTDSLRQLIGNHMVISPTAAEGYYRCPFSYLIKNLFKIYPLEKAALTQREAGDYLHTVAQKVMEQYRQDYHKADWTEIEAKTKEAVAEYLSTSYPEAVRKTARFASLSNDMEQNALHLLRYIHTEQQASLFRPVAFEKQIGFDSDVKPVTVTLDDGSRVSIIGVCDRIDTMEKDGRNYIRIVDYKTGSKNFSLDDVYNGISSQLLLYMNSVVNSKDFLEKPTPAAVMYQPSDAAFKFDDSGNLYTPTGMALESDAVCEGFDANCEGEYGIIKGRDGKLKSESGSAVVNEKLFKAILDHSQNKIKEMAENVYGGKFDNLPLDTGNGRTGCEYCGYRAICRDFDRVKPKEKAQFTVKEEKADG
ncbi:MAG: hypothetical protein E7488_05145 [Ruminococcaceae bacterium]|nr:hypothetical protein [Oscillospiraceae bacterium]